MFRHTGYLKLNKLHTVTPSITQKYLKFTSNYSTDRKDPLKTKMEDIIPKHVETVKNFRKEYGNHKLGEVTVNMLYGGMRGVKGLLYETSELDMNKGITFRNKTIEDCIKELPKAQDGSQPLPEGLFWLLMTSEIPNKEQVEWISTEWARRGHLPDYILTMINNLPAEMHPMTMLSCSVAALNKDSIFQVVYSQGKAIKSKYWQYFYEDGMDLLAKIITIAGMIYRKIQVTEKFVDKPQQGSDWSKNLCDMMGLMGNNEVYELLRLHLTLHSDHEGGNVSAHAVSLVGSALSDAFISFSSGINGLAGPLHGLANEEVLKFIIKIRKDIGDSPPDEKLAEYVKSVLKSGQVIPGFGHAVLRVTDPRYIAFREFGLKHMSEDPLMKIVGQLFKVVPPILKATGKVQNPWPNVDAHSGVLLQHYGITNMKFYTVLFAVSRALGTMASLVWARALGLPIERPKSYPTDMLMKMVKESKPQTK